MTSAHSTLHRLVLANLGEAAGQSILDVIQLDPLLLQEGAAVSCAVVAMAMNVALMHDLLARVPTGAAYVEDRRWAGERICFDHGAVRTILFPDGPTGALPGGEAAFTRILEPLGYRRAGLYPLDRLRMTGRAYAHADFAETIPQFFVSELHLERFPAAFQSAARRVFGTSRDPIGPAAAELLRRLGADGAAPFELAVGGLSDLVSAFGRQHEAPSIDDYRILREQSAEGAWIATEGNAFNHVTDRVADVVQVADHQRRLGRPIKDEVEVSTNGRVRQTAFRADSVRRRFASAEGPIELAAPGSFYEFISRDRKPDGGLDLGFDSGNAQGIFKMTASTAPTLS